MGSTAQRVRRAGAAGSALTLALMLVACSDLTEGATRSGGTPPPTVLTIGTDDPPGRPASDQMAEFADQVESRSDGALRIELRHRAAGVGVDDWDQAVARLVVDGDLDLGMVPARAWDTEGVTSLRALTTPLLVTTDEHMDAVALDDELSRDLLAGLDEVGITGLALMPEGIRHLMTVEGGPGLVDRLAAGGMVRSPLSETTWSFFEALGARPTDAELTGEMVAAESQVALAGTLGSASTLVGNLPLFAKVNSLVVNTEAFGELTEEQQDWLNEAARATRDWAVDTRADDHELATAFCEGDGTIVHASGADSFVVTDAATQVTDGLRADAGTSELIDRIAALDGTASVTPLARCSPSAAAITPSTLTPDPGRLPDGVYRVEFTDDYLASQGVTLENIGYAHGVWTVKLRDGRWQVDQVASDLTESFEGTYQVRGDDLYWLSAEEQLIFRVPWSLADDGSLRFGSVEGPADGHFHWGRPWQRVGDATGGEPAPAQVTADTIVPEGGDLPDGTYRFRLTDDYLAAHGLNPENVAFNHGVWTTVLDDGRWTVDQVAPDITDHLEGIYQVDGRDLWWRFDEESVIHLRWTLTDAGDLVFEEVPEPEVPDFQFDLEWQRVA